LRAISNYYVYQQFVLIKIPNSSTDEWYDLCRLGNQSMGQFFIERDEMGDINVTVILLEKNIFPYLISVIY